MLRFGMTPPLTLFASLILVAPNAPAADTTASAAQAVFDHHCIKCHGPLEQKAGLQLDSADGVAKGSDNGPVVVPGKSEDSKLIQVLADDSKPHMPPKKQLADEDVAKLRAWIASAGRPAAVT